MQSWLVWTHCLPSLFVLTREQVKHKADMLLPLTVWYTPLRKLLYFSQGGGESSPQTAALCSLLFLQRSTFGGILCEGNGEHSWAVSHAVYWETRRPAAGNHTLSIWRFLENPVVSQEEGKVQRTLEITGFNTRTVVRKREGNSQNVWAKKLSQPRTLGVKKNSRMHKNKDLPVQNDLDTNNVWIIGKC